MLTRKSYRWSPILIGKVPSCGNRTYWISSPEITLIREITCLAICPGNSPSWSNQSPSTLYRTRSCAGNSWNMMSLDPNSTPLYRIEWTNLITASSSLRYRWLECCKLSAWITSNRSFFRSAWSSADMDRKIPEALMAMLSEVVINRSKAAPSARTCWTVNRCRRAPSISALTFGGNNFSTAKVRRRLAQ